MGGLREETEDRDLEDHFEEYGRITRAMVMKNSYGSRRFGFVTFEEQDSLEKALEKAPHMINKKLVGETILKGEGTQCFLCSPSVIVNVILSSCTFRPNAHLVSLYML